jgi:hypothetical protein
MLFWKKSKKLELRCYSLEPQLPDFFPIELSKKVIPEWYKNLPPYSGPQRMPTTKMCPGLQHLFNVGITIPLWFDYTITRMENGTITNIDVPRTIKSYESHHTGQWEGAFPGWHHLKLLSPWFIEADRPVPFMAIAPTWHQQNPGEYVLAPGMMEFRYQHATHAQLFLPPVTNSQASVIKLEAGTPMIHFIPTEDVDIELKFCEMDDKAYKRIVEKYTWTRENLYRRSRKILENMI